LPVSKKSSFFSRKKLRPECEVDNNQSYPVRTFNIFYRTNGRNNQTHYTVLHYYPTTKKEAATPFGHSLLI